MTANLVTAQEKQELEVEQLDEVVLSDTKFELKKENSGKIIYKITKKDIDNNPGKTVVDLLNNVAGVEINGNNNAKGSTLGLYFRGGRSRQVAVMIDGVLVSDPTGIASTFDLNLIDINQIESIEILKGSSSTLYGSGASTGVINIKLKKSSKAPIAFNYSASAGTNSTQNNRNSNFEDLNQSVGLRGTVDKFNYLANYSVSKSDGISAASDKNSQTPFETDAFLSNNGLLKLGYQFNDKFSLEFFGNYSQYDYDYDNDIYSDSEVNNGNQEQFQYGIKSNFKYNNGELVASFSLSDLERGFDTYSSWTNSIDSYLYEGKSTFAEIVNKYNFNEEIHLITGLNYQDFDNQTTTPFGNIERDLANFNTFDPYASIIYTGKNGVNLNVGARLNNHSEYGSHFVYNLNPSYNLINNNNTKLKVLGSYSTAFIAPSTYQLFSAYGNLDLKPEENKTIEFGFDSSFNKWLEASSVFFYREEESKIVFVTDPVTFESAYGNELLTQNAKGVETTLRLKPLEKLRFNLSHTYTNKSADLDYIPKNKFIANITVTPFKNTFIGVNYKSVGDRTATYYDPATFTQVETIMESYSLVDFSASHMLIEHLTVFASLTNAFNENYEDIYGYSTKGRNFKLGLRFNF
ncbi:hypothetical protein LPB138_02905 [Urechidicola croceus]|uniref:TonB-dependent receptor n=1 Tax=Urechidicola croceus TaxID=1850246 RepID=A0A1D8PBL8_9FLAO|nr:hypothetical protein LPB138_02905 [Urechidicola croceus]